MDRPVELIPLVCLKCSTPIPAEPDQVAWICGQCGTAMVLDSQAGLQPLEVQYFGAVPQGKRGLPFWVAEGQVSLQRQTYSGNNDQQAQQFWGQPRRFLIPAYNCSLDALLSSGCQMLEHPPALPPGSPSELEPVTLSKEDVHAAAEFIVLSIEAARKDKLREVRFQLQLSEPVLWILPPA